MSDTRDKPPPIAGARFQVGGEEFACIEISAGAGYVFEELSAEENAVSGLVLEGLGNEDIARVRGVSNNTIENQISSIFRKLGVFSRAELVVLALRLSSEAR